MGWMEKKILTAPKGKVSGIPSVKGCRQYKNRKKRIKIQKERPTILRHIEKISII